jgi:hypothetical protein
LVTHLMKSVPLTIAILGAALVSRLAAQATGVPVRNAGVGQGISAGVDFGLGRIDRSGSGTDDVSRAIAGSLAAGLGPIAGTVGLTRTTIDPATGANRTLSAASVTAELTLLGGPLVPLKVVWLASYARQLDSGSQPPWRGSLGAAASLTIPAAVVSIRPWIAPRLDYLGRQLVSGARLKPSLSGGVDLGFLNGLGLRVGYDNRLGWDDARERASGVSVGVRYHFR